MPFTHKFQVTEMRFSFNDIDRFNKCSWTMRQFAKKKRKYSKNVNANCVRFPRVYNNTSRLNQPESGYPMAYVRWICSCPFYWVGSSGVYHCVARTWMAVRLTDIFFIFLRVLLFAVLIHVSTGFSDRFAFCCSLNRVNQSKQMPVFFCKLTRWLIRYNTDIFFPLTCIIGHYMFRKS